MESCATPRRQRRPIFDSESKSRLEGRRSKQTQLDLSYKELSSVAMMQPNELTSAHASKLSRLAKLEESLVVNTPRASYLPSLVTEQSERKTVSKHPIAVPFIIIQENVPFFPRIAGDHLPPMTPPSYRRPKRLEEGVPTYEMATATTLKDLPIKVVTSLLTHSEKGTPVGSTDSNLRSEIIYKHSSALRQQQQQRDALEKDLKVGVSAAANFGFGSAGESVIDKDIPCNPFGCLTEWFSFRISCPRQDQQLSEHPQFPPRPINILGFGASEKRKVNTARHNQSLN